MTTREVSRSASVAETYQKLMAEYETNHDAFEDCADQLHTQRARWLRMMRVYSADPATLDEISESDRRGESDAIAQLIQQLDQRKRAVFDMLGDFANLTREASSLEESECSERAAWLKQLKQRHVILHYIHSDMEERMPKLKTVAAAFQTQLLPPPSTGILGTAYRYTFGLVFGSGQQPPPQALDSSVQSTTASVTVTTDSALDSTASQQQPTETDSPPPTNVMNQSPPAIVLTASPTTESQTAPVSQTDSKPPQQVRESTEEKSERGKKKDAGKGGFFSFSWATATGIKKQ